MWKTELIVFTSLAGEKIKADIRDYVKRYFDIHEVQADYITVETDSKENLKNVIEAAGSTLGHVVKTTVFLKDMIDFPRMNAIYAEFFPENPPARSTVAVAGLPKGGLVEIEVVALIP